MSPLAIIILACIPAIFFFIRWAYKFNNPFKLFFVVGKKGSGKTSYLCKLALDYSKKGYVVYTNVSDLRVPGIRIITDITTLGDYVPVPYSVLLLDEVSLVWDNRHFKEFKDCTKEFFRLQRHHRCIVYLFSQTFDVDKKIRDLADRMFLCTQFFGRWSLLREIDKKIVITEASPDAESRISENLSFCGVFSWRFIYIPKYQAYFDSFVLPERPYFKYNEVPYPPVSDDVQQSASRTKRCAALLLLYWRIFRSAFQYRYHLYLSRRFWPFIRSHFLRPKFSKSDTFSSLRDFWRK